jgi:hypothetical protein
LSLDEAREEGDKVAEYEHLLRDQIKTKTLGWTVEPINLNRNEGLWIMYLLMAVHVFSFIIAKYLIGSSRYLSEKEREEFPRKFKILTAVLLLVNSATAFMAIPTVLAQIETMGYYYQLWIIADVMMLFFAQFNIALEYMSTHNNDHSLAEYVYQHIQDTIAKSMRERIGSMISKE